MPAPKELRNTTAGLKDCLVTIEQPTETKGPAGESIAGWGPLLTLWACRQDVDAPERFTEGLVQDQISARAWMKWTTEYRAEIDPLRVNVAKERRLVYLGRTYDIAAATLVARNRGVTILTLSKAG